MLDFFGRWATWGPVFLRVVAGVTFIVYGYPKLFGPQPGPKGYARFLQSLGFSPPLFWAYLAGIAEFGGGLCVLLGFLTRLAALVLAIAFVMFMVKVKWTRGFRMSQDAWAWYWALLAMVLSLLVIGPGRLALDHQIPTGL